MEHKIINTKYGEIEYRLTGKGTPILFVHGGHSNCNETLCQKGFDKQKYQLITPSRPGYGKTHLDGNESPQQAANIIIELLNHLKIDKIIVYGISAGGLTAIAIASYYPEKVSKLILASAVSKKWLEPQNRVYKTAKMIFNENTERLIWSMVRFFSKIMPTMIAKSFYPEFSKLPKHKLAKQDVKELISALKQYNSKKGFLVDIDQNIDEKALTKIVCPTLIIHSENDNSVSLDHALHAKNMIEKAELIKLNNEWGHLFWIGKDANESINTVLSFIEKS